MKLTLHNPERDTFFVPHSVQDSIPIKRVYGDGIFEVGGKFSKSWRFFDINYKAEAYDKQVQLFMAYCAFLNALPLDAGVKITLFKRRLNQKEFGETLLLQSKNDGLDRYRREQNEAIISAAAGSNNLIQEKYITVSVVKKNVEEARIFFSRVFSDLRAGLSPLDSTLVDVNINERLRLFHDFFRPSEEQYFQFDLARTIRRGHDFRDTIAPDRLTFKDSYYQMGGKFGRVLFLRDYGSYIKDDIITTLMDEPYDMMLSIDIVPEGMNEAIKMVDKLNMAVNSDITRWQQRQNARDNFTAVMPYDLEQTRKEAKEMLNDLTERDQRVMYCLVTLTHLADSLKELDQNTESLKAQTGSNCSFGTLYCQQEDGLNTVLPYGLRRINALRTLTTESTAVLMPFRCQEIQHKGGLYYGVNAISGNLIVCNRGELMNANGIFFGTSGTGKSMAAKQEIAQRATSSDDTIIIIDPEREYGPLVRALGGEIILISADSDNHINALDISDDGEGKKNPLGTKSDFIMSLCAQIMGVDKIDARAKSIIDRCVANVYHDYIKKYEGEPPTLKELHDELLRQEEPLAGDIALALELFTTGSLNVFAHKTNVDTDNRIICFDTHDLGENLKPIGLLVMLDAIMNRVIRNRTAKRFTHIYVDELYLFFSNPYSSEFLSMCWRRFRKYYADLTGITQNVEDCLNSETARNMFANSEFLLMLSQSPNAIAELTELLGTSEQQMAYVRNKKPGQGLMKVGGAYVPFVNDFPKDTELYKLFSTKPGEG